METSLNILVVDDDIDAAEGLSDVLEMSGHRTVIAGNGKEALEVFPTQHFDAVFMDVQMPGMNGVDCFLEIKTIQSDAKVIMMTGYDVENSLERAVNNGAAGVIHKPFPVHIVTEALRLSKSERRIV